MKYVKEAGLITRFKEQDILDREKLDYDLHHVDNYMRSKGYLQARHGEPRDRRMASAAPAFRSCRCRFFPRWTSAAHHGSDHRRQDLSRRRNEDRRQLDFFGTDNSGLHWSAERRRRQRRRRSAKALYENLKKDYGNQGFIEYTAELTPTFKDNPTNPNEGIVDFVVTIDEGKQFTLRRLEFTGNTFTRDNVLRREVLINEGDIYNQTTWEYSVTRLNQLGYFDPIDKEKDADFKTERRRRPVDVNVEGDRERPPADFLQWRHLGNRRIVLRTRLFNQQPVRPRRGAFGQSGGR